MKKILFLVAILSGLSLTTSAQKFNKLYKNFQNHDYTASLELDSCIIMASNKPVIDENPRYLLLIKIDKNSGDTILTKKYVFDGIYGSTPIFLIKSDENSFYVIGYAYDGSKSNNDDYAFSDTIIYSKQKIITSEKSRRNYTYYFKVNTNLDTIFSKKYNDKYFSSCFEKDSTLLLGGQTFMDSLHRKLYLCEIKKTDGELIKDTIILTDTSFSNPIIQGISKSKKGDYIFCATTNERGILFRMDSAWNIEWLQYYTQAHMLHCIAEDNDTNMIVGGLAFHTWIMTNPIDPPEYEPGYRNALWKFDKNGNLIWHKRVGFSFELINPNNGFSKIDFYKNSFIAWGQNDTARGYIFAPTPYLYQFDNNGNELRHRYFKIESNSNYLFLTDISKKENGYILSGFSSITDFFSRTFYRWTPFVISVDSLFRDNWNSWDTITHFEITYKRYSDNKILKNYDTLCLKDKIIMEFKSITYSDTMALNFDIYGTLYQCPSTTDQLYTDSIYKLSHYLVQPNQIYTYTTPSITTFCPRESWEPMGKIYLSAININQYGPFYRFGYD